MEPCKPPASVQAVIFDLGKVLVDFDYGIAARRIAARCTRTPEAIAYFIGTTPLFARYEMGLVTSRQFYQEVGAATGFGGDYDEFSRAFGDIFAPIEAMVELHASLRKQGMPTYIFSNTNELAVRHIRSSFPFFSQFDDYILSYEHGVMKPAAGLYEVVERQSGHRGGELLYLDDRPENIAAGAERGWQVILHESPAISAAAVCKVLNSAARPGSKA